MSSENGDKQSLTKKRLDNNKIEKNSYNLMLVLVVVLAVVIVALLSVFGYLWWMSSLPLSKISVVGEAKAKQKPDKATITVYYSKQGQDVKALNQELDRKTEEFVDYLISEGISEDVIVTNKVTYPDYGFDNSPEVPVEKGTRAELSLEITFENISQNTSKPGEILNKLLEMGVVRFDSFRYSFNNAEQICRELQTKAIEDGYKQAENQIRALNGKRIVRKEVQFFAECTGEYGNPISLASDSNKGTSVGLEGEIYKAPKLQPGEQELVSQVSVTVEYR